MIAIATVFSTLFGPFSADAKPASAERASSCCRTSRATEQDACRAIEVKPEESQLNSPAGARYVCPMHPEVTSENPGLCAKCNMKLEPKPSIDNEQRTLGQFADVRRWPK